MVNSKWMIRASTLAMCMAFAGGSALAQEIAPRPTSGLEEIIVTARRVAENMQSVPVAVTSFSGEALEQQNVVEVPDVARLTPGFTIKKASGTPAAINLQIRGQYQSDVLATLDPSVGTYVDGYYWARAYGLAADLLDVRSAQVLRGPQGTLFGRNTTGGALVIETNDPDAREFSARLSATYGRFDERSLTAIANVPIIEDRLALRGAFNIRKRDGFINEVASGEKMGEVDNWTGRIKLLARPTETLSIVLSAERHEMDSTVRPWELTYVGASSPANLQAAFQINGPGTPATRLPEGQALIADYMGNVQSTRHSHLNELPSADVKTETYTANITFDTFFGAVKAITGYRRVRSNSVMDLDGSPFAILRTDLHQDLDQFSGELQFTGSTADGSLDFVGGAFYFEEAGFDRSSSTALPALSPNPTNFSDGVIDTRSQGIYAQASAHVTDALSLTAGLRYSVDDKGLTIRNRRLIEATGDFSCNVSGAAPAPDCSISRSDDFGGWSYVFGADYEIRPELMVYAKTSKGFRSGGQNLRAQGVSGAAFVPFQPEIVYETEAGLKSEFFDRRVRFNLAGFYSRVNNIQRSTLITTSDPDTGQVTTATIVGNAGKVRIYGGEAELTARLFDGFTLSGAAALTKPKYLEYIDPNTGVDRSAERFEQVPKWTLNIGGMYERDFDFGSIQLRADYSWQSRTALIPYNDASNPDNDLIKTLATQKGGTANVRVGYRTPGEQVEIALFGRNVFNRQEAVNALYFAPPLSALVIQRRDPATYGLSVSYFLGGK